MVKTDKKHEMQLIHCQKPKVFTEKNTFQDNFGISGQFQAKLDLIMRFVRCIIIWEKVMASEVE